MFISMTLSVVQSVIIINSETLSKSWAVSAGLSIWFEILISMHVTSYTGIRTVVSSLAYTGVGLPVYIRMTYVTVLIVYMSDVQAVAVQEKVSVLGVLAGAGGGFLLICIFIVVFRHLMKAGLDSDVKAALDARVGGGGARGLGGIATVMATRKILFRGTERSEMTIWG
jgi:hypothetical protein